MKFIERRNIITVNSPARIHLGFLELNTETKRYFASLGLAISKFHTIQKIQASNSFEVISKNSVIKEKVKRVIKIFSKIYKIKKCRITILESIPIHQGLGSGTQIAITAGYLISKFNNLKISVSYIAQLLGRGNRSGIGIRTFQNGGFIVDSGKKKKSDKVPSKIFSLNWPKSWKIIIIRDETFSGLSGDNEVKEFSKIEKIPPKFAKENCYNLIMNIIPGIIEKDFSSFSMGIQVIQENMSKIFYGEKNIFASKKISEIFSFLNEKKYTGYGQSSWGPTGFIFCENDIKRKKLNSDLQKFIEFKKIEGINLLNVDGRNYGKKFTKEF